MMTDRVLKEIHYYLNDWEYEPEDAQPPCARSLEYAVLALYQNCRSMLTTMIANPHFIEILASLRGRIRNRGTLVDR